MCLTTKLRLECSASSEWSYHVCSMSSDFLKSMARNKLSGPKSSLVNLVPFKECWSIALLKTTMTSKANVQCMFGTRVLSMWLLLSGA